PHGCCEIEYLRQQAQRDQVFLSRPRQRWSASEWGQSIHRYVRPNATSARLLVANALQRVPFLFAARSQTLFAWHQEQDVEIQLSRLTDDLRAGRSAVRGPAW